MLNGDSVNKVILMGRIGKEPRWQSTEHLRTLCFTVVTTEKIKRGAGTIEHEEYHQVRISENLVNAISVTPGRVVYVQGRLQTRQTTDEHGAKHYKAEIIAYSVEPVDVKLQVV